MVTSRRPSTCARFTTGLAKRSVMGAPTPTISLSPGVTRPPSPPRTGVVENVHSWSFGRWFGATSFALTW